MKRNVPPLLGERVRLRLLREEDLPLTLAWRNADCNRMWFFDSEPIDWERHLAWFSRYRERDDDFLWIIETLEEGRPVGQVSIYDIDWASGRAEFGRLLVGEPAARGKGFAKDAVKAATTYAVETWRLREICCHIRYDNAASRATMAAAGYTLVDADGLLVRMAFARARA
ncbi:MAG TPA: GNAT family N-acetyltransferase [Thermoanaerobaculaceae bacterium]|nr:GNAT family N-acetyltransferase [Thermoanaerobaculaceae bacterium]HRS15490.1 GNAT family N-acetyltransferase [Thermoanaerobaculaceae bacterium]